MKDQQKYQEGLSPEQVEFIQKHKIHPRYVFDGIGMNQAQYRPIMKILNKGVAFNVPPCKEAGHTLRTRSGHCCQCNTARLEFQKRNDSGGNVYIAGTVTGETIKVGFTKSVEIRSESLNRTKYAGYSDWEIIYAISSKDAGRIETQANVLLQAYELATQYIHDGHWQDSFETFKCSFTKAKEIINIVCNENDYGYDNVFEPAYHTKYEFNNLIKLHL